jgi:hypothetical protein
LGRSNCCQQLCILQFITTLNFKVPWFNFSNTMKKAYSLRFVITEEYRFMSYINNLFKHSSHKGNSIHRQNCWP